MFKIVAVLGLVAGGAGYALYEHTDLFGCKGGSCPLSKNSCCSQPAVTPACYSAGSGCDGSVPCCETAITTTVAACCADPCLACALVACEACAECADCCGTASATAAVAGPAAVVPAKSVK